MESIDISKYNSNFLAYKAIKFLSVTELITLLSDNDAIVRKLAAQQLQKESDDFVFDEVKMLTTSPVAYIRETAAFVLGQLGTPNRPYSVNSLPALLNMIDDVSTIVRASAIASLGHLYVEQERMPDSISQAILPHVSDSCSEVRACVAFALGHSQNSELVVSAL